MSFDEARIAVISGRGGGGAVHFRREKYVPHGGPDGGDGGRGGSIVLRVDGKLNTLHHFRRQSRFRAKDGTPGRGKRMTGADGEDTLVTVPPGTMVFDDASGELVADLVRPGEEVTVCRGGRGGRGNARFATPSNQAPRMAERGEPGEERQLRLELRLLADVGIVGLPNAGKSTLLAALSNARPKIADYPFTTLEPNLGVAELEDGLPLVLADIPGLIEGAHRGVGLGATFLRHIMRTKVLIHLVDGSSPQPLADFSQLNSELALYDEQLKAKRQVVAVNKMDLAQAAEGWPRLETDFKRVGVHPLAISAMAGTGLDDLLREAVRAVHEAPAPITAEQPMPTYRAGPDAKDFRVSRDVDGSWRVSGKAIERAAEMTYWEFEEPVRRFQGLLRRLGVEEALRAAGATAGDTVRVGKYELEWID